MKRICSNPTDSFILDSFINDSIDRNVDVIRFFNVICAADGSSTIALNGQWGSGKTVFVRQTQLLLDYFSKQNCCSSSTKKTLEAYFQSNPRLSSTLSKSNVFSTVYYDSWENDNDIDPVLSIIYAVTKSYQNDLKVIATHNVGNILSSIAEVATGRNITAFFQAAKGQDFLESIRQNKSLESLIRSFFATLTNNNTKKIILFIDELDRCKPSYAITLLERIKHFFNIDCLTFVFSLNMEQLLHTVKNYYGNGFSAYRYLEKFFDHTVQLPTCNENKFLRSLDFDETHYTSRKICRAVIKQLKLQLREQIKYVQLINASGLESITQGHASRFYDERAFIFLMSFILPLLLGLFLVDIQAYRSCVNGDNAKPLIDFFTFLDKRILSNSSLLTMNETFSNANQSDPKITYVDIRIRVQELYEVLFIKQFDTTPLYSIGSMTFDNEVRSELLETVCLLSKYTNY